VITKRFALKVSLALSLAIFLSAAQAKKEDLRKHYGLIFGTAYGPDDRPLYGVKVRIHPVRAKHPGWELVSDHRGEFAQRVPPGPADYLIVGQAEIAPVENGVPNRHKKKKLKAETRVHIDKEERQDISLHLRE
jgi:hypothetical protein